MGRRGPRFNTVIMGPLLTSQSSIDYYYVVVGLVSEKSRMNPNLAG